MPRPEYPRPLLVRPDWKNLNGSWRFVEDVDDIGLVEGWFREEFPKSAATIHVPFPVESEASTVNNIQPASVVWYYREFDLPEDWDSRTCLRFGACDHWTRVFVNGQEVGQHRGGYA
ncbi:MAG: beta-galactosidase, partial [Gammaproteobacteria bacterium]|nr:beta-galactosidase [Gammaproteobacteria bacterium]